MRAYDRSGFELGVRADFVGGVALESQRGERAPVGVPALSWAPGSWGLLQSLDRALAVLFLEPVEH